MSSKIYFVNQNTKVEVEGGTLAQACERAGYPLNLVCGGRGSCGKCLTRVKRKGAIKIEEVLACSTLAEEVEEVYLEKKDYVHEGNVLTHSSLSVMEFAPAIKKRYVAREELTPPVCGSFLSGVPLAAMKKFAALRAGYDFLGATFVYYKDHVIDIQEGHQESRCYGVAIDIGTTTVACYFYDLAGGGRLLETKSALNQQVVCGADVISRSVYAQESPENLAKLQDLVLDTINCMIEEAAEKVERLKENLYHVVICGNSMMQHLFYGWNPVHLGMSPFVNITAEHLVNSGKETGLHCAPEGVVEFLPLLGGFVGADTTAVLLTVEDDEKKYMMIDLGTNGEIAVGNQDGFLVSSTACGPALEGGNIECGMRGTPGAIEKISLENDRVSLQVIGDIKPQGLCGSAIIDAVSEFYRVGLMDDTGALLSADTYQKSHPGSKLSSRIKKVEEHNLGFYFTEGENPVYLSQKDIRQIQLAKSSIYSGCMTLLEEYGMTLEEIDALILAGAFGTYIDVEHAIAIGMLPPVSKEKIVPVGNGAGQGVQSLLLDDSLRTKLEQLPGKCKHVSLAENTGFMDLYIRNMNFGNVSSENSTDQ
ncbi:MAG: ASKHA domain-containing protein [Eubacteriales bacterium]|nr:ASKHA domain-containing protein [Eubacteriales bacterium]